jgi:hypothetical protein
MILKIELNEQEAQLVLNALGELKAVVSFDLITKLKKEFEEQIKNNNIIE